MRLTDVQFVTLDHIAEQGTVDIRRVSEPFRQRAIDLAMLEPPLVDIDADRLFATPAGLAALSSQEGK